ncbi:MAG: phosphorylase [Cyanobacteria bacterium QS_1_48_34]|nr:MAG: phosphorylase [Cyanobacteria bacterium QS_1_48_34]
MTTSIDAILVPQGAEYRSVCKGLSRASVATPPVFAIPAGGVPLTQYLERWQQAGHFSNLAQPNVLLMGLCGSLLPQYSVGDVVLYESCWEWKSDRKGGDYRQCDRELTASVHSVLQKRVTLVKALTSDILIYSAPQKCELGQLYGAEVVDMEGLAALEVLTRAGVAVAMLRVVSDDCRHDLPNLSAAFHSDGSFKPLPLGMGLLRQPLAATRLVSGAMRGLRVLQDVTTSLFSTRR